MYRFLTLIFILFIGSISGKAQVTTSCTLIVNFCVLESDFPITLCEMEVIEPGIYTCTDPDNSGGDFCGETIFEYGVSICALPVKLLNFSHKYDKGQKSLIFDWQSAVEVNNKRYYIKYAADGVSYSEVLSVDGKGNSNTINAYTSSLSEKYHDLTGYYQLWQEDFDGKQALLSTKYIEVQKGMEPIINIFPNPASEYIEVHSVGYEMERIEVYNVIGELLDSYEGDELKDVQHIKILIDDRYMKFNYHYIKITSKQGFVFKSFYVL